MDTILPMYPFVSLRPFARTTMVSGLHSLTTHLFVFQQHLDLRAVLSPVFPSFHLFFFHTKQKVVPIRMPNGKLRSEVERMKQEHQFLLHTLRFQQQTVTTVDG